MSAEKESKMSMRKINTKQLTAIRPIINPGKKQFLFRYYCPDLQKDNIRKFANTEVKAKVLREQIKENSAQDLRTNLKRAIEAYLSAMNR